MVSEWLDGVPLSQAPDPDDAAAKLVRFALGSHRFGVVHADLKPDDVLVLPEDGRIAVLDFGAAAPIAPGRVDLSARALDAYAERDPDALGRVLEELGSLPASLAPTVLELAEHALGPLGGSAPSRLDVDAVSAARDRLLERPDAIAKLMTAGSLPPEDLWPARSVGQTFSTVARMGATGPWLELARSALRDGWD
jgi:predicted unusual protein kinase regulating ubiquinone biosynthesis (AarF/ABC1/UbiB family)